MNDTYLTFNGKITDKNELVFMTYLKKKKKNIYLILNVLFFRIT